MIPFLLFEAFGESIKDLSKILFRFHVKAFSPLLTLVPLSIEWCCNNKIGEPIND